MISKNWPSSLENVVESEDLQIYLHEIGYSWNIILSFVVLKLVSFLQPISDFCKNQPNRLFNTLIQKLWIGVLAQKNAFDFDSTFATHESCNIRSFSLLERFFATIWQFLTRLSGSGGNVTQKSFFNRLPKRNSSHESDPQLRLLSGSPF